MFILMQVTRSDIKHLHADKLNTAPQYSIHNKQLMQYLRYCHSTMVHIIGDLLFFLVSWQFILMCSKWRGQPGWAKEDLS